MISYKVDNVTIREHIAHERMKFKYQGEYYTFVKLRMNKEVFDSVIAGGKKCTRCVSFGTFLTLTSLAACASKS